jgi:tellurite resistance protein TerC
MHTNIWLWILFNAGVICALAIDLFAVQKRADTRSVKEAAVWTAVWLLLSLGFNAVIWYSMGQTKALEFLTGYLVEYSLSVDNIFVFVLIFSYFRVPENLPAPSPLLGHLERVDPARIHDRRRGHAH